jgi:hypothetical protein
MVKIILASDLEAQQILQLNKHILVANQIRKAGRNAFMSNLVKHSQVSKQQEETMTVSNSFLVNERMEGKCTTWNVSNGGTLASDSQGSNLLRKKLLNPNGNDSTSILSPSLVLKVLLLLLSLLVC